MLPHNNNYVPHTQQVDESYTLPHISPFSILHRIVSDYDLLQLLIKSLMFTSTANIVVEVHRDRASKVDLTSTYLHLCTDISQNTILSGVRLTPLVLIQHIIKVLQLVELDGPQLMFGPSPEQQYGVPVVQVFWEFCSAVESVWHS